VSPGQFLAQFAQGLPLEVLRLCVWLALLVAIFAPLERLAGLRPQKLWRREALTDLGYYFLNSLLTAAVIAAPIAVLSGFARAVESAAWRAAVDSLPLAVRLAAALLVGEIGFYWGHRITHAVPWLWRFHATHHAAEHMDFLVNTRAHPVDMVFTRLCGLGPLAVLGLAGPAGEAGWAGALVMLAGTLWGFFIHANLRWRFGWLERVVATPGFHHWHHSRHEHLDRNFASMLPVLDAVFGTLHLPKGQWPSAYGVEGGVPEGLAAQLVDPLKPARA
jgi:sterol desaturase/sphingolipid hydroxylase (fatty acid hydroxylase superfamily)